ncbi:thioredoxin family protein [Alicyclobacillus hesperidum]|uniref:thioredoxin family protein n=1 Tax=Alicyclobacillus hesperidum TaxID=89784 RepID=UPI0002EA2F86|nr:thioredoxin family protein [Alicyclobacillus hesperidum]
MSRVKNFAPVLVIGVFALFGGIFWIHGSFVTGHRISESVGRYGTVGTLQSDFNVSGMQLADWRWMREISAVRLTTVKGKIVPFPTNRPVLIVASWCPYCAKTLTLLQETNLLDKVQLVGAGNSYVPEVVNSSDPLQKAKTNMKVKLDQLGIDVSLNQILLALPKNGLDSLVHGYPTLLVPRDGMWYVKQGYVADKSFWFKALASHADEAGR